MCWISFKLPKPKIATEDIVCYKIFRCRKIKWNTKVFYSLYRDYQYIAYASNPKITINFKKFHTSPSCWYITEGYHSYNTLFKAILERIGTSYPIVKCIIPIGSTYYLNNEDEIVSSDIIITDKIIE